MSRWHFSQTRERQPPFAPILPGEINFQSRLEVARQGDDDERALRGLSQKLLIIQQRAAGMHR
ncbi:hypothetical protein P0D69_42980 [Paraburkholderia sediminicola]|uniref:hypothetical protein n=1 Tax=Paraburkholderia sediminicola TaxID=458836 RepID=UPI0038BD3500